MFGPCSLFSKSLHIPALYTPGVLAIVLGKLLPDTCFDPSGEVLWGGGGGGVFRREEIVAV